MGDWTIWKKKKKGNTLQILCIFGKFVGLCGRKWYE